MITNHHLFMLHKHLEVVGESLRDLNPGQPHAIAIRRIVDTLDAIVHALATPEQAEMMQKLHEKLGRVAPLSTLLPPPSKRQP